MKDEALDFLPLIIVLGLVIPICFGLVIPIYNSSREAYFSEVYDKSMKKVEGYEYILNNSNSPDFTYTEMIMLLGTQNDYLAKPKVMEVGRKVFEVQGQVESTDGEIEYTGATTAYLTGNVQMLDDASSAMSSLCSTLNSKINEIRMYSSGAAGSTGISATRALYNIIYYPGTKEGTSDDTFVVCLAGLDSMGNKIYFPCHKSGSSIVIDKVSSTASSKLMMIQNSEAEYIKSKPVAGIEYYVLYK